MYAWWVLAWEGIHERVRGFDRNGSMGEWVRRRVGKLAGGLARRWVVAVRRAWQ